MKRATNAVAIALLFMVVGAAVAVAQHNHAAMSQTPQAQSSDDMMKSCQKHGSETMATLDQLEKTIAAGRASNDPAKMKAALDEAQKLVATAKHHMSMCPMMGGKMQHGDMDMKDMSMPNSNQ